MALPQAGAARMKWVLEVTEQKLKYLTREDLHELHDLVGLGKVKGKPELKELRSKVFAKVEMIRAKSPFAAPPEDAQPEVDAGSNPEDASEEPKASEATVPSEVTMPVEPELQVQPQEGAEDRPVILAEEGEGGAAAEATQEAVQKANGEASVEAPGAQEGGPQAKPSEASEAAPAGKKPRVPRELRPRDQRLPEAGAVVTRIYKGKEYRVDVLKEGFQCEGYKYSSLSALASELTGNPTNGFLFFKLGKPNFTLAIGK